MNLFASCVLIVPDHPIGAVSESNALTADFDSVQWTETRLSNLVIPFRTHTADTISTIPLLVGRTKTCSQISVKDSLFVANHTIVTVPVALNVGASAFASQGVTIDRPAWSADTVIKIRSLLAFACFQVSIPGHSVGAGCATGVSVPVTVLAFALTSVGVVVSSTSALDAD